MHCDFSMRFDWHSFFSHFWIATCVTFTDWHLSPQVEFSEESDMDESSTEKTCVGKKTSAVRKAASKGKAVPGPQEQRALPKRQTRSKRSTAEPLVRLSSSEDEATVALQAAPTRTRTSRRNASKAPAHSEMEPDGMRTTEENLVETLDMSFEQLRISDAETEDITLKENSGVYFQRSQSLLTQKLFVISSQEQWIQICISSHVVLILRPWGVEARHQLWIWERRRAPTEERTSPKPPLSPGHQARWAFQLLELIMMSWDLLILIVLLLSPPPLECLFRRSWGWYLEYIGFVYIHISVTIIFLLKLDDFFFYF